MKSARRVFIAALAASMALAAVTIETSRSRAAELSPELKSLIVAANAEGRLDLSWAPTTASDNEDMDQIAAAMGKEWGSTLEIHFTPGPSMPQIGHQLAMEYAAGEKAATDIYHAAGTYLAPLIGHEMFIAADWQALLPGRLSDKALEAGGQIVRIYTGLTGATYNTKLAPMTPKTLADFLKPEWKGKFASTTYAAGFDTLAATDVWGPEKTLDYVRKLARQVSGLIRCSELERIASGEYLALVMDCSGQGAAVFKERGAPLDQMVPLDAAQMRYYYMAVPKNASHPNAAKLFIAFLETATGQSMLWNFWHSDLHFYKESHTGQQVSALEAEGAKFTEVTTSWLLAHPEIEKTTDEAIKILTSNN